MCVCYACMSQISREKNNGGENNFLRGLGNVFLVWNLLICVGVSNSLHSLLVDSLRLSKTVKTKQYIVPIWLYDNQQIVSKKQLWCQ